MPIDLSMWPFATLCLDAVVAWPLTDDRQQGIPSTFFEFVGDSLVQRGSHGIYLDR